LDPNGENLRGLAARKCVDSRAAGFWNRV